MQVGQQRVDRPPAAPICVARRRQHAQQTARVMTAFEEVVLQEEPDLVLVVGDVNSTLACSLVASKLHVPVAHVEAGLRSFNREMPEEHNRVLTDQLADWCFTTNDARIKLKRLYPVVE